MWTNDRLAHSLAVGEDIEVRGPIPTFSISPGEYDRIVMVSTGTGVAPFLQLLSRIPGAEPSSAPSVAPPTQPKLDLIHLLPSPGKADWASEADFIPRLQTKFGDRLTVHRPPPEVLSRFTIQSALKSSAGSPERVMVLICLPPQYVLLSARSR